MVALFFAVNKGENDGEVIIFDIPDNSVCHYNSDKVTILANLAKCGIDFSFNLGLVPFYRNKIRELISKTEQYDLTEGVKQLFIQDIPDFFIYDDKIEKWIAKEEFELNNLEKFYEELKVIFEKKHRKLLGNDLNYFRNSFIEKLKGFYKMAVVTSIENVNNKFFGKLLHNIREDKAYFDSIIDPVDVLKVFAVRPKLDNPRIVRQQGTFLIFGIKPLIITGFNETKPMAELNKKWVIKGFDDERIIIDKDSKNLILKELEQLGVNQSTLFPEVDKVADFVRKKYQDKL